jgi:hypothetical protein
MSYPQSTTLPATDPQKSYLRKLAAERLAASMGATSDERVARVNTWVKNGLTKRQASQSISWLQSLPIDSTPTATVADVKSVNSALTPGVYEVDNHIYVVKPNRAKTRLYAKRLIETHSERLTESGDKVKIEFVYESGAIFNIKPEHRMDFERAKALTIRYGRCIVCGRGLKAGKSVEQGIGPVCRKLFS